MNMEVLAILKSGDLVNTKSNKLGTVLEFDGDLYILSKDEFISPEDIVEVRRPIYACHRSIVTENIWHNYCHTVWKEEDSVFLGVSYKAHPMTRLLALEALQKKNKIVEFDESASLLVNNNKIAKAARHIIVPPESFGEDNIIGEGLYQQILVRQKAGKSSEIYVNGTTHPIKKVYKLEGDNKIKSALVIY